MPSRWQNSRWPKSRNMSGVRGQPWVLPFRPSLDVDLARGLATIDPSVYRTEAAIKALFGTFSTPAHYATGTDGLLYSVAANALDCFTVPGGACRGQLIEEARTTLAPYARTLDELAWTLSNITKSAATGADGVASSAVQLTATANNATAIAPSVTLSSAARRFAPYIKRVAGTGNIDVTFDNGSNWTTLTAPTSEWTRIGAGATLANPQIGIRIASSGDVILLDFANGETGSFDTSPVASTTAVATRAASSIIRTLGSEWNTSGAGSAFSQWQVPQLNTGVAWRVWEIADGATAPVQNHVVTVGGPNHRTRYGDGDIIGSAIAANTVYKSATRFADDDMAYYVNGALEGVDTSLTPGSPYNTLYLGGTASPSQYMNGYLKRIALYTRGLTNAELAAVTA